MTPIANADTLASDEIDADSERIWKEQIPASYTIDGPTITTDKSCGTSVNAYTVSRISLNRQSAQTYRMTGATRSPDDTRREMRQSLLEYFCRVFASLPFPTSWADDGFTRPSKECTDKAAEIATVRFFRYRELPVRHSISKAVGILLEYTRTAQGRTKQLFIEVDDELDAVAVLSVDGMAVESSYYDIPAERDSINGKFLGPNVY